MTNIFQVCSKFHRARTFISNTHPGEIDPPPVQTRQSEKTAYTDLSRLMQISTHLNHIVTVSATFGTNWSTRWSSRVFIINTSRDENSDQSIACARFRGGARESLPNWVMSLHRSYACIHIYICIFMYIYIYIYIYI